MEKWLALGTPLSRFEVSSHGRFRDIRRGPIPTIVERSGYRSVCVPGIRERKAHWLVALAFVGPCPGPKYQINHIDGNPSNNHADNLEWVTPKGNCVHAVKVLGRDFARGHRAAQAKLSDIAVLEIVEMRRLGRSVPRIAQRLQVSVRTVYRILRGESWRHVARQ